MSVASRMSNPIEGEIFRHLSSAVAEEMGVALERSSYSPNIKERRDYSCAVFDPGGKLVAQAAHIPVHLGAFPHLMDQVVPGRTWEPGDVLICNDPRFGGTHLPDISVVSPVFAASGELIGFVANRAHHADVGGAFPGSMAPTTELYQEGVIIPPLLLEAGGRRNEELLALLLRNVRTPDERLGDLSAQLAANRVGAARLRELGTRYGTNGLIQAMVDARTQSAGAVRRLIETLPVGRYEGEDFLDDDGHGSGPLAIRVAVTFGEGRMSVDFTGTAPQARGSINATLAVTLSASYYVLLCLLPEQVALNQGVFDCVSVSAPEGSLVHAIPPAAVAAGNVETSQRTVDALLRALASALPEQIPAASQGTMNNLTLGGLQDGTAWAYYETTGGGSGATSRHPGATAIHCHMSNTRNTPAEALEYHYPLRLRRYALRDASGGAGLCQGGDGVVRELELLDRAQVTWLTDRRERGPYGLFGGESGAPGENSLMLPGEEWSVAPSKGSLPLPMGARIRIGTPGGGGWGNG